MGRIDGKTYRHKSLGNDIEDIVLEELKAFSEGTIHAASIEAFLDSEHYTKITEKLMDVVHDHVYQVLDRNADDIADKVADW